MDAQNAAMDAFHLAQDAARAVTLLTRSIGGLPAEDPGFDDLLADPTKPF